MSTAGRKRRRRRRLPRSSIVFVLGVAVIVNEVSGIQHRPPNPAALLTGAALCGIPVVEGTESRLREAVLDALTEEDPDVELHPKKVKP